MKVRSRVLRAGVAAVTAGGFALAGIGVLAGPAGAFTNPSAGFINNVNCTGCTFVQAIHPTTIAPATPLVPGGTPTTNNQFSTTFAVFGGGTTPGDDITNVSWTMSVPAGTSIDSYTPIGWTVAPTCTPTAGTSFTAPGMITCSGGNLAGNTLAELVTTFHLLPGFDNTASNSWTSTASNVSFTQGIGPGTGSVPPVAANASAVIPAANIVAEATLTPTATPPTQNVIQGGNTYTQTVGVTNAGPSDATGVSLTVTAPTVGGVAIPATATPPGCVGNGTAPFATFTCTPPGGVVAAGTSATFGFTWRVPATATPASAPNPLTTTVTVATVSTAGPGASPVSPNPAIGTHVSATANIVQPLSVTKTGPTSVTPGSTSPNLQYTVSFTATQPLTAVQLRDPVPAGTTFVSATKLSGPDAITCALSGTNVVCGTGAGGAAGPVAGTGTDVVAINFQAPANYTTPNPLTNAATVRSTGAGQVDSVTSNTTSTNVTPLAVLNVTKTQTSPNPAAAAPGNEVQVGSTATYTITVSNAGPSDAQNVTLTDTPSAAGVSVVSIVPAAGNPDAFTCTTTCSPATVAAGHTDTFTATVRVNNATGLTPGTPVSFNNVAAVTTTTPHSGSTLSSTANTLVNLGADLAATLTGPTHFPDVPGSVLVTFGVTNNGPLTALNPTATLTLPNSVTFAGFQSQPPGSTCTPTRPGAPGATITCTLNGNLASGASATWTILAQYPVQSAAALPDVTIHSSVGFGAGTPSATVANFDPNGANNNASFTTTAGSPPAPVQPTSPSTPTGRNPSGF